MSLEENNSIESLTKENTKLIKKNEALNEENRQLKNMILEMKSHNKNINCDELNNELLLFLERSELRVQILKSLNQSSQTPNTLLRRIKYYKQPLSKYLKSLKEKGLIVCLNEDEKMHRVYTITPKGRKYLKFIEEK